MVHRATWLTLINLEEAIMQGIKDLQWTVDYVQKRALKEYKLGETYYMIYVDLDRELLGVKACDMEVYEGYKFDNLDNVAQIIQVVGYDLWREHIANIKFPTIEE